MAHNLFTDEKTGKTSLMVVGETPWHGLGQVMTEEQTAEETIRHAGLDYDVAKVPVYCNLGENQVVIEKKFATYRTDTNTPFGIVGDRYEILQNREAFSFFDTIVGEGLAIYTSAGALGKGETVFISAKMPNHIKVGGNDIIEKYLLLTMAHDGSKAIQAMFTPVRVLCQNTLNAALRSNTNKISIRHTTNAREKLEQAHKLMKITNSLTDNLSELFNNMATTRLRNEKAELTLFAEACYPSNPNLEEESTRNINLRDELVKYYYTGLGQDSATTAGTVFGLYNAITGLVANAKKYDNIENRFESVLFAGGAKLVQSGFDYLQKAY